MSPGNSNQEDEMSLLSEAFSCDRFTLKNHLVFPPIGTHSAQDSGEVSEKTLEHYRDICSCSNIGLAVVEHCYVDISGKAYPNQISLADDCFLPGLTKLAAYMKANGTKAFLQLNHCGSLSSEKDIGMRPLSASDTRAPKSAETPRAMTIDEIHAITDAFVKAATRVKEAGFDGVEIHAAHSYLLNQFYSPLTNNRTDEYGGSRANRFRFIREVVSAVREAVGTDFLISVRLGACDYMDGGLTAEDGIYAAEQLEAFGVDIISVTGGLCQFMVKELMERRAYFEELSAAIKEHVSVPVILTGGISDAEAANSILADGAADLIGVGRAIFKDHCWGKNIG